MRYGNSVTKETLRDGRTKDVDDGPTNKDGRIKEGLMPLLLGIDY